MVHCVKSYKRQAKSRKSIHLLCQNKGDGNHYDGRAEATVGWGVHGAQAVKRAHAMVCSGSSSLKMRKLRMIRKGGEGRIFS